MPGGNPKQELPQCVLYIAWFKTAGPANKILTMSISSWLIPPGVTHGRGQPGGQPRLIGLATWRGVGELYNSEGLTHAASVAYYAPISLFPFLLLSLAILGQLTADPAERDAVVRLVSRYFPRQFDFITGPRSGR